MTTANTAATDRTPSSRVGLVTDEMVEQFHAEGYFLLERALSDDQLAALRGGANLAVEQIEAMMDESGSDQQGLSRRNKRYFRRFIPQSVPQVQDFLFSDLMAEVCRATLGPSAYLFWEQYVIKASDEDSTFAWHQDSGYVHENHDPYLTVWIALDDVTEDNGTVYLLPYSRSGIRTYVKHVHDPVLNDKTCYFGSDPGIPVSVPAGSIAVFSSMLMHRSGANLTDRMRRVYVAQYSADVIMDRDGTKPWGQFDRFLADDQVVARTK